MNLLFRIILLTVFLFVISNYYDYDMISYFIGYTAGLIMLAFPTKTKEVN